MNAPIARIDRKEIIVEERVIGLNPSVVFTEACASMASRTLPLVWLNNHVKSSDKPTIKSPAKIMNVVAI